MAPKLNDDPIQEMEDDVDDASNSSHFDNDIDGVPQEKYCIEGAGTSRNANNNNNNNVWFYNKQSLVLLGCCTLLLLLISVGVFYQRISNMTEEIVSLRNELLLQQLVTNETQFHNKELQMENIHYKKQLITKQALIDHNEQLIHTLQSKLTESQQLVFEEQKRNEWIKANCTIERILHFGLMRNSHTQFNKTIQLHVTENEMLRKMLVFSTFITNDRDEDDEYEKYEGYVRDELSSVVYYVQNDLRTTTSSRTTNRDGYKDILRWCGWILHSLSYVDLYRGTIIDSGGLTILSDIMKEFKEDCYYFHCYVHNQARLTLENIVVGGKIESNNAAVAIVRDDNDNDLLDLEPSEPIFGNIILKIVPILYHYMMVWIYKPVTDYVQYFLLLKNRMKFYYNNYFTTVPFL